MFRARLCAILGFGLMFIATSTEARELELSIENRIGGDSNVLRQPNDEKDDGFYEFAPQIVLREDRNDELNYAIRYQPRYRAYFETNGIDGWDHIQSANIGWQATARDSLTIRESYSDVRSRRLDDGGLGDSSIDPTDRDRTKRARASALYSRGFTPVLFGQLGFDFEDYDFEQSNLTDNRAFSGTLGATYAVLESTTVGLTALGRYRDSRGLGDTQEETATDNYVGSIAASIAHQLTPTMSVFLQGGPSFIRSVPDDGSVDPETDLTFFATASVEKHWRTLDVSAAYTRTESGGSGAVSSQILDAVDLDATYTPYPDWQFRLLGRWSQQKVASTFQFVGGPVQNDRELTRYRVVASAVHRFTDRISVIGRFEYTHQKQDRQAGNNSTTQIAQGFVGVRYTFEPWVF